MSPFIAQNPFNPNEWWEISGNTRRLVTADQKAFIQFTGGTAVPISLNWFVSYPVASG